MMNGSKPCGPSGGLRAPSPGRRRSRLRVSCSPSPQLSLSGEYVFSVRRGVVARICNLLYRRFVIGRASESSNALALAEVPQNAILRYSRLQICATLNAYPREGETFGRDLTTGLSLVVVCLRNERQRSGGCNRNVRIIQRGANALPLLGERAGMRGNEANSNSRRTTIPGTVTLREPFGRAADFPIWS